MPLTLEKLKGNENLSEFVRCILINVRRQKIHPSFEVLGPEVQNRGSDGDILSSIPSLFVHHTSTRSGLKLNRDNCIPICSPLLDDEGIFINIKKSRFALCCNGKYMFHYW